MAIKFRNKIDVLASVMIGFGFGSIASFITSDTDHDFVYLVSSSIYFGCGAIIFALSLFFQKLEKVLNAKQHDSNSQ